MAVELDVELSTYPLRGGVLLAGPSQASLFLGGSLPGGLLAGILLASGLLAGLLLACGLLAGLVLSSRLPAGLLNVRLLYSLRLAERQFRRLPFVGDIVRCYVQNENPAIPIL